MNAKPFKIPAAPSMDPQGLAAFKKYIKVSSVYLEFGCGGSTIYAAANEVKVIFSVETDAVWADAIRGAALAHGGKVSLQHCDIGPTQKWGYPYDASKFKVFHRYALMPWEVAAEKDATPDLVLVDGRFRVACFLASLVFARQGVPILFDDYVGRAHFKIAEEFCPLHSVEGRMAVFVAAQPVSFRDILGPLLKYSVIPN